MSQIECLREKLYKVIESGDPDTILKLSRELDKLILSYFECNDALNSHSSIAS